jgi:hypothetical protein
VEQRSEEPERARLKQLVEVCGNAGLRVSLLDQLSPRLQQFRDTEFSVIDGRIVLVFQGRVQMSTASITRTYSYGYLSAKPANVAFYKHIYKALSTVGQPITPQ